MKTYLASLSCSIYSILYPKSEDKKIPFKKYIYLAGKETRFWGWKILAILLLCFLCFICIYLVTYPFLHSNAYYMTSFTSSFLSSPNWLLSKTIESFSNNLYPFILSLFLTLLHPDQPQTPHKSGGIRKFCRSTVKLYPFLNLLYIIILNRLVYQTWVTFWSWTS